MLSLESVSVLSWDLLLERDPERLRFLTIENYYKWFFIQTWRSVILTLIQVCFFSSWPYRNKPLWTIEERKILLLPKGTKKILPSYFGSIFIFERNMALVIIGWIFSKMYMNPRRSSMISDEKREIGCLSYLILSWPFFQFFFIYYLIILLIELIKEIDQNMPWNITMKYKSSLKKNLII